MKGLVKQRSIVTRPTVLKEGDWAETTLMFKKLGVPIGGSPDPGLSKQNK